MINKLEVLNTIAAKHGHTDWHTATWNLTDDDINELTFEAMELYAELSNSHKHGVMQAEGSDVSEGAAVASSAVGQNVSGGLTPEALKRLYNEELKYGHSAFE
jgi:hypothetical protein